MGADAMRAPDKPDLKLYWLMIFSGLVCAGMDELIDQPPGSGRAVST